MLNWANNHTTFNYQLSTINFQLLFYLSYPTVTDQLAKTIKNMPKTYQKLLKNYQKHTENISSFEGFCTIFSEKILPILPNR